MIFKASSRLQAAHEHDSHRLDHINILMYYSKYVPNIIYILISIGIVYITYFSLYPSLFGVVLGLRDFIFSEAEPFCDHKK